MTAPDVRTAAQAEAEATAHFGHPDFSAPNDRTIKWATYVQAFGDGAVWGAALVTPTREQIAKAMWDATPTPDRPWELAPEAVREAGYKLADAVLALMRGVSDDGD